MGTLFWLEYKRNLFSLPFFMSAVILAVVFITQCLPEEWRYYKEPMEKAGFIYEMIWEDLEGGATKEIKAHVYDSHLGRYKKEIVYEKIRLEDETEKFMKNILKKMGEREHPVIYQEFYQDLEHLDMLLGNDSYYEEDELTFEYEYYLGYYLGTESFEMAKERYQGILEEGFTNAYARYYADYLGIFAGLLPAVYGAFILWYDKRYQMQEMIYSKRLSSWQYVSLKYLVVCGLFFFLYMAIAGVSSVMFYDFSKTEHIVMDMWAFFKYNTGWVMPTVCVTTAGAMLLYCIFNHPLPAIFIELILFFLSVRDLSGNYYLWKPVIRFNLVGEYEFFKENFGAIVKNRGMMIAASLGIVCITVLVYEQKRKMQE